MIKVILGFIIGFFLAAALGCSKEWVIKGIGFIKVILNISMKGLKWW